MIITQLEGGLGNQFFQYALGLKLAKLHNTVLKSDPTLYRNNFERSYKLGNFKISGTIASKPEVYKYHPQFFGIAQKVLYSLMGKKELTVQREAKMTFNPEALNYPNDSFLAGYWQSEKYFKDIRSDLLEEFQLNDTNQQSLDAKVVNEIETVNAVSVHIRRGDYVTNKTASDVLGFAGLDYYERAKKYINSKVENPHFFVFSDDLEWVKENMNFGENVKYMESNPDYIDITLMSKCKHNIIANSSFSWWSAWLNQNPNKIIIAPKNWFKDPTYDSSDLIPEEWIKL